jgi:hypothetical protein
MAETTEKQVADLKLGDRVPGFGEVSELRLWPGGTGFEIYFWPTEYSEGDRIRLNLPHTSTVDVEAPT